MEIKKLKIYSSNLPEMEAFYSRTIGFPLLQKTDIALSYQIGNSILTIEKRADATPYHFAINIPSNQIEAAHHWLQQRVPILKDGDHEIQDFDFWNAEAVYFYDVDKNILEFIARKNLANESSTPFDVNSLLEISEIGLVVESIEPYFKQLQKDCNLPQYSGNLDVFCTLGGEHGLFICINGHKKDWFPTGDKAFASEFEVEIRVDEKMYLVCYKSGKLVIN